MALNDHLQKISEEKERYDESYNDYDLVCRFRSLTQLWKKLIKKSEVPDIRFHDLRIMLKQGIHPKIVSERLGHKRVGNHIGNLLTCCTRTSGNCGGSICKRIIRKEKLLLEVFVSRQKHRLNNPKYYK